VGLQAARDVGERVGGQEIDVGGEPAAVDRGAGRAKRAVGRLTRVRPRRCWPWPAHWAGRHRRATRHDDPPQGALERTRGGVVRLLAGEEVNVRTALMSSLITGIAAAACGGAAPGVVDMDSARASVDQAAAIAAAMSAMNGPDAAIGIEAMMIADQTIVTPSGDSRGLSGVLYPSMEYARGGPRLGSAVCTATSCTFTGYGVDGGYTNVTMNGTATRTGDSIAFAITYDMHEHFGSGAWSLDGALSVTADRVDGSVHAHGTGSREDAGIIWDNVVDYHAITRDAEGCPVGGSLHAVTSYDASQEAQLAGSRASFELQGTATFGPTCM
jgi:hypothetical protein